MDAILHRGKLDNCSSIVSKLVADDMESTTYEGMGYKGHMRGHTVLATSYSRDTVPSLESFCTQCCLAHTDVIKGHRRQNLLKTKHDQRYDSFRRAKILKGATPTREQKCSYDEVECPVLIVGACYISPLEACLLQYLHNMAQEGTSNPQSSKQDKDTNPAEGSSELEESNKNTPQSLKAKSKIGKKFKGAKFKTMINTGSQQIGGKRRLIKNKKVVGDSDELPKEKPERNGKNIEKESQNRIIINDRSPIEKSHRAEKNKVIKVDKREQKRKNSESDKGTGSRISKNKHEGTDNIDSSEKQREKFAGFIFMCSGKTKPDCFHYRVMGVSATKKDVVLSIKPGTKLFLYDFDLRLLYGIYKASSSGGMKLEPRAFGGSFPAQVRFNIVSDCFPLPESIFKKAIKENYNEKHKFKTELTARQVRKLTELFRPVDVRSGLQPVRSPPKAIIHDRDAIDEVRGSSLSHLHRESDPLIERRDVPRDLFLTEKSYRAYGLQGDRRNVIPASHVNTTLDPYERDYERDLHHVDPLYPSHREKFHASHRHLNENEHHTYLRGGISDHADDPYHPYRYRASPRDPYLPPREEITSSSYLAGGRSLIRSESLQRREPVQDRLYSTYSAADALSEYNRMQHYQESLEATAVPDPFGHFDSEMVVASPWTTFVELELEPTKDSNFIPKTFTPATKESDAYQNLMH
ncbi:unnamed protein product [Sphenostylis stenocarpa]|uniref:DCD domain-containing protein n=1 Tax=Sphenostylis stenocarpa TaxID=92480 RepID=A0AA86TB53_9FABA|nr:unnamed protein product [Sphenostylis stenocarpa]